MENASKAVIMAGSVLIAIAVISMALYAYAKFNGYVAVTEEMLTAEQIQRFNSFYESFEEGTGTIRGIDALNIIKKAIDDELAEDKSGDVSPIPALLQGSEQSKEYLENYSYKIIYDVYGKVDGVEVWK